MGERELNQEQHDGQREGKQEEMIKQSAKEGVE